MKELIAYKTSNGKEFSIEYWGLGAKPLRSKSKDAKLQKEVQEVIDRYLNFQSPGSFRWKGGDHELFQMVEDRFWREKPQRLKTHDAKKEPIEYTREVKIPPGAVI